MTNCRWCLTNYTILCYLVFKLCHIVDTCPASALSFPSLWLELQMMDIHRCFEWTNTHDEIVKNSTHLWNQEHCGGVESHCSLQKAASRHPYKRYSSWCHWSLQTRCLDVPSPNLGKLFKNAWQYRWFMHFSPIGWWCLTMISGMIHTHTLLSSSATGLCLASALNSFPSVWEPIQMMLVLGV